MFNFTTVVFDGTSPTFYFTNTSGWNTSSSKIVKIEDIFVNNDVLLFVSWRDSPLVGLGLLLIHEDFCGL